MVNLLNDRATAAPQAPPSYSAADIRAAQAETAANMLAQENQRLQQAALYRQAPAPAPRATGPDPLMVYNEKNLTQTAEENARLLDAGVRGRARQEANRAVNTAVEGLRGELQYAKQELGLQSIMALNPDIANDPDGYAAAIGKAQFRTSNQNLDPMALANLATQIYKHERMQQQNVPFVEGAGRPNSGFARAEAERPVTFYEKLYGGVDTDEELIDKPWNDEDQKLIYLDGKNNELVQMGANPSLSKIREVRGEATQRRARTKQRGAA
jgi:hypothetical protein